MSEFFESLKTSLEEAIDYEKGNKSLGRSQVFLPISASKYRHNNIQEQDCNHIDREEILWK